MGLDGLAEAGPVGGVIDALAEGELVADVELVATLIERSDEVGCVALEALVDGGGHHRHIGAPPDPPLDLLDALGSGDEADGGHVAGAALEQVLDGGHEGVTGGQHGVNDEALAARQVVRQPVGVGLDLQGVLVALHTQEADLGRGQQPGHALEHAQARPQDRHHNGPRLRQTAAMGERHRRGDLDPPGAPGAGAGVRRARGVAGGRLLFLLFVG